jgi:hypothetical protein
MPNFSPFLLNQHFIVQAQSFHYEGSASHSESEHSIFVVDTGSEPARQLLIQMNRATPTPPGEPRAIDGVAPEGELLVVRLAPKLFFNVLEALYEARRERKALTLTIDSDNEGRIARFDYQLIVESLTPPGETACSGDASDQSSVA